MSFLHNLYTKVISDSSTKKNDSYGNDNYESPVFEEFEDGFVVYTERDSPAAASMHGVQDRLEYNRLQSAAPGYHYPSGSPMQTTHPYGSKPNLCARGATQQTPSTFITVSDIPLKLSKPLEMIYNSNKATTFIKTPFLDIEEFLYDFRLEKTVLNSREDNDGEMR